MRHFINGLKLLVSRPSLWPSALAPMFAGAACYVGLFLLGLWFVSNRLAELSQSLHLPESIGRVTGSAAVIVVWIFLSGPIFMVLFGLFAVPAWDALSRRVEIAHVGFVPQSQQTFFALALDVSTRVFVAVVAVFCVLVVGWMGFGILGALLSGLMMTYDLTAPSYVRRGVVLFEQPGKLHRCKGWFSLWLMASISSLVPFVNILLLPVYVVASTLMVLESELEPVGSVQ